MFLLINYLAHAFLKVHPPRNSLLLHALNLPRPRPQPLHQPRQKRIHVQNLRHCRLRRQSFLPDKLEGVLVTPNVLLPFLHISHRRLCRIFLGSDHTVHAPYHHFPHVHSFALDRPTVTLIFTFFFLHHIVLQPHVWVVVYNNHIPLIFEHLLKDTQSRTRWIKFN